MNEIKISVEKLLEMIPTYISPFSFHIRKEFEGYTAVYIKVNELDPEKDYDGVIDIEAANFTCFNMYESDYKEHGKTLQEALYKMYCFLIKENLIK